VLNALVAWLSDPARADLRRAFEVMIERVMRPEAAAETAAPTLEEAREMLETNFQRWEREWHERSEAHGRAEGRAEGEAIGRRFILRQLERRFGPLDASVGARVEVATAEQLLSYADRVLDADDIESFFAE
jgi:hypothetical protein